ncbi:MAG: type I polyketide synthase, partial [Sphingobacteriales bacterium]
YNKYGPTEATISSIQYRYPADAELEVVPIGKPIANTQVYIVGADGNRVPAGIPGEIYIGGAGVARGYLNNLTLTAEKFSANPFSTKPGERIYKTGDTGRFRADGTIEFVGRIDDQVKIRGHRIELSEIETVLGAHEAIDQCVVIAQEDQTAERRLLAYVVVNKAIANGAIRQYLASKLPEYMLPSLFVQMASLPLTANGKVDKKALVTLRLERASLPDVYAAPVSPMERQIETIWAELLQLDKVGRDDNFFELGGNSLLAISAVAGLKRKFGYTVPITKLYQQPTIKALAAFLGTGNVSQSMTLKRKEKAATQDIAVIGMAGRFPGADSIEALWTLLKEGKETTHFFT